ncbi:uncharacterized protein LOC8066757 isoform X5 [Sorghum bicolor]|uniref:uncharacterized protein LOC8066757 isoform X5 n=1 Tax=Sorghum bicolor TaxID=4558 RepID=UPI000B425780|nr:uncharacterized protein LOC8066757 isoform X5 [Sorghum bicolor]|eukprot:XP_021303383.1 uncharacterized protein LOC8066757 isoform X5 [Sorghum bicolor]
MATTEGLVPITRTYLARYYDNYPLPPLPDATTDLAARLRALSADLAAVAPITPDEELLEQEAAGIPAHKIDENLWKNREQMEEILFLINTSRRPVALQQKSTPEDAQIVCTLDDIEAKLKDMLKKLEQFQLENADSVFNTVMTYMPQDFRGTLIRQQRERSERNKQAEVDALVSAGGSIHDRYALLWKQQMERRVQLAQLGSATGVYKTLVRYLVGVPQVLLDFIRQINDDNGEKDDIDVLQQAVVIYTKEFLKFTVFIGEVFVNAPFFISAEDAGAMDASTKSDEYKEIIIPAGKTHEVILSVEAVNSYIAWDFSLQQGALNMVLDIGFHVEHISPSGEKTLILPHRRYEADQGNFCTVSSGSYKLVWDNSYSSFFKKILRYKVDAVPPVVEPALPAIVL